MQGWYILRKVTDLDKLPPLGLLEIVINLTKDLIIRLRFLIQRKHRMRVNQKGVPPTMIT